MNLLRSMGLLFLFVLVPLGALLANYPEAIAAWLSAVFDTSISRGNLGVGFLLLAAICLKVDLTLRRRAQGRTAA